MANPDIIAPEPEPNGLYCAFKEYEWIADCPDADFIEWVPTQWPEGMEFDDVIDAMSNPNGLINCITFPVTGDYCFEIKKCYRRKCHPLINESQGKSIVISCNDGASISGQAIGFFPGDVITINPGGITTTVLLNGEFTVILPGFADGDELEITANGLNHNACPVSATTTSQVDSTIPCSIAQVSPCAIQFGMQVTYISGSQICGVVQGFAIGDVVEIEINGTIYQGVVFPDPNTGLPIWCVDVTPADFLVASGQGLVASITDAAGNCTVTFPFVFV